MKQYTKQALSRQLKVLAKQKPLDKITVTELAEACDIKRQTFYYHFQDIYDLLGWIFRTEAVNAISNKRSYDTWQEGLEDILQYVQQNRELCINTYRSLGREHLETFLNQVLFELLGAVVEEIAANHVLDDVAKEFITKFYSFAFAGTLLDWIRTGLKSPYTTVAHNISVIMDGNFRQAIEKNYL